MKLDLFSTEANKIWKPVTSNSITKPLQFELNLHKKLLSFFQAGDYYYWIFNPQIKDLDLVSAEVENVLGYQQCDYTLQVLMDNVHPDDRPWFLNFENKVADFLGNLPIHQLMNYKIRYDFRIKKKDGTYARILHQSIVIEHDEYGDIIRTLGIHTDITYLKPEGKPTLSIIGLDGEPSYINVDVKKIFAVSPEVLSKREKQVLMLLIEGKLSKEIGEILHISKQTVDKHRKNMLNKNMLNNTSELIGKAIKQGWL